MSTMSANALTLGVIIFTLATIFMLSTNRLLPHQAGALLLAPLMFSFALLRPAWTLLVIVAIPPTLMTPIPARPLTVLMLVGLFGLLLQGYSFFGLRSGVLPLLGLIVLAFVFQADVGADATVAAENLLKFIVYYTVLLLVSFQAARSGAIRTEQLVNALLIGVLGAAILRPFESPTGFSSIANSPFRGPLAYLAVIGFSLTFGRLLLRHRFPEMNFSPQANRTLMWLFLALVILGFGRAAWIVALLVVALIAHWAKKRQVLIIVPIVLTLFLTIPVFSERIVPQAGTSSSTDINLFTTGRWLLWNELWDAASDGLPLGNGFGFMWSLDSEDLFGFEGQFVEQDNPFVFPHNDFLFLTLELGIPGLALFVLFWLQVLSAFRHLMRSNDPYRRYSAYLLTCVALMMLGVSLFDNGFATRSVAERFFITAGFIFGLARSDPDELPFRLNASG